MKILITGSTGLARNISDTFTSTPVGGGMNIVNEARIEDLMLCMKVERSDLRCSFHVHLRRNIRRILRRISQQN